MTRKFDELLESNVKYNIIKTSRWYNDFADYTETRKERLNFTFKELFEMNKDDLSVNNRDARLIPTFKFMTEDDFKKITSIEKLISKINSFRRERSKHIPFYSRKERMALVD